MSAKCTTCKHAVKAVAVSNTKEIQSNFNCVRFPPTPVVVMQQTVGGINQVIAAIYPTVNEQSIPCSEYQEKMKLIA